MTITIATKEGTYNTIYNVDLSSITKEKVVFYLEDLRFEVYITEGTVITIEKEK